MRADARELGALYDHLFRSGAYASHRQAFEALSHGERRWGRHRGLWLRRLERRVVGRKMIEIGGGAGGFGVLATLRGWRYQDFDISSVAVDFARRLGLEAYTYPATEPPPLPRASADAVVMWEVLEHIWDVASCLRTVREALRPDGFLMLSTPNWRYVQEVEEWGPLASPPVHCNFFDTEALTAVLETASFGSVRVAGKRLSIPGPGLGGVLAVARLALGLRTPETLLAFARVS